MTVHPHLPSLRADADRSPWTLLPGVVMALTVLTAVLIAVSFVVAELVAGHAY
jgi:hypothetical protein